MRALVVVALLAGCFNPKTDKHCQFQCATSGTPCPSGLSCVAGMCVAPGETCGGDAGIDGDARVAACGDGFHDPGEICYGTPISIVGTDVTYDGQLADMDGDGDLDLVYLIGDQYVYHPLDQGVFGAARNGPTVFSLNMRALNLDGDAHAELINVSSATIELWNFDLAATNLYTRTGNQMFSPPELGVDLAIGAVSGARPNAIALESSSFTVYDISPTGVLSAFTAQGGITGPEAITAGRIDADTLDDILVARMTGISYHRSTGTGLAPAIMLPVTGLVTGVAIGDTDNDMKNDIVFTQVAGAGSRLGVMHAQGAGAFTNAMTLPIAGLQKRVTTAKIDGDGRADAVALKTMSNAVLIALGNGDGTLAMPVELPLAVPATYVHADADFNGDGMPDIVATDFNSQTIVIFPSNP